MRIVRQWYHEVNRQNYIRKVAYLDRETIIQQNLLITAKRRMIKNNAIVIVKICVGWHTKIHNQESIFRPSENTR